MKRLFILSYLMLIWFYNLNAAYHPQEFILQFKKTVSSIRAKAFMQENSIYPLRLLSERMNIWHCKVTDDEIVEEKILVLQDKPEIKFIQFNHILELRETLPNDEYFSLQWHHQNSGQSGGIPDADMDSPAAWDWNSGGTTVFGDSLVIAVVDNGADLSHPDLSFYKNRQEIPDNGIDDDDNGYIDDYDGWNAYSHNGNISSASHGTHCCGIAAAAGNNYNGVCGVNWNALIMPVAGSSSSEATVVEAYSYVLEMRSLWNETDGESGAYVVATNSSFGVNGGNPVDYPVWASLYDSLGARGILSAAATANVNWDIDENLDMPTACTSPWLISVTNTDHNDEKYPSAGYGQITIDLGAPGTNIYSTDTNSNGYNYKTGTSMASPQVAGAVALMFSEASPLMLIMYEESPSYTALLIKEMILEGVDPIDDLQYNTVSGGRLNLYNALLQLQTEVYGDIDNNGYVEAFDSALILQYFTGFDPAPYAPLPWQLWRKSRAEVDGNGFIEAYDASLIMRYAVDMISAFPIEE